MNSPLLSIIRKDQINFHYHKIHILVYFRLDINNNHFYIKYKMNNLNYIKYSH